MPIERDPYRASGGFGYSQKPITVPNASTVQLLSPSPHRTGFIVGGSIQQTLLIGINPVPVSGEGLPITTVIGSVPFFFDEYGPIVSEQWFVTNPGAQAQTITAIEVIASPAVHARMKELYNNERRQSNQSLSPDYGFLIGVGKSPSGWLDFITTPRKPLLDKYRNSSSGIRRWIYNAAGGTGQRLRRSFRVSDQG